MHFTQHKQFSETNVTLDVFQQISGFKIFPECVGGPLKRGRGPHAAHKPVFGPHCLKQYKQWSSTTWCVY